VWSNKNKLDPKTVTYTRKNLKFKDYNDISSNLPQYIDYLFNHIPSKWHYFNFPGNWKSFNSQWRDQYNRSSGNIYLVKYEDLLQDTEETLRKIIVDFFELKVNENRLKQVIDKFSFENQTNRNKGEEDLKSFLRKGISGDWKNNFDEQAKAKFKRYAGKMLIELGYEKNTEW
jgi:hypothetical protein